MKVAGRGGKEREMVGEERVCDQDSRCAIGFGDIYHMILPVSCVLFPEFRQAYPFFSLDFWHYLYLLQICSSVTA